MKLPRQPVHTVYGGAHLFRAETFGKLRSIALQTFKEYAPDSKTLLEVLGIEVQGSELFDRVEKKLREEAIEDYRVDFEDGYGIRSDREEDEAAETVGREAAEAHRLKVLPPFFGIRIRPLATNSRRRSLRTLNLFASSFFKTVKVSKVGSFRLTLPKVKSVSEVSLLLKAVEKLEKKFKAKGFFGIELMVESPEAIFDKEGRWVLPKMIRAAKGRCLGIHFGAFDYTASLGIVGSEQKLTHPACDFARHHIQVSLADAEVQLSDGATNILPIPPHRAEANQSLSPLQLAENRRTVHAAWQESYRNIRHSLSSGFYQGWDLHPAQIPVRYAATYAFFLEQLPIMQMRLKNYEANSERATRVGNIFDDAASARGLKNFFSRAHSLRT